MAGRRVRTASGRRMRRAGGKAIRAAVDATVPCVGCCKFDCECETSDDTIQIAFSGITVCDPADLDFGARILGDVNITMLATPLYLNANPLDVPICAAFSFSCSTLITVVYSAGDEEAHFLAAIQGFVYRTTTGWRVILTVSTIFEPKFWIFFDGTVPVTACENPVTGANSLTTCGDIVTPYITALEYQVAATGGTVTITRNGTDPTTDCPKRNGSKVCRFVYESTFDCDLGTWGSVTLIDSSCVNAATAKDWFYVRRTGGAPPDTVTYQKIVVGDDCSVDGDCTGIVPTAPAFVPDECGMVPDPGCDFAAYASAYAIDGLITGDGDVVGSIIVHRVVPGGHVWQATKSYNRGGGVTDTYIIAIVHTDDGGGMCHCDLSIELDDGSELAEYTLSGDIIGTYALVSSDYGGAAASVTVD
jgi:hypothetical protein